MPTQDPRQQQDYGLCAMRVSRVASRAFTSHGATWQKGSAPGNHTQRLSRFSNHDAHVKAPHPLPQRQDADEKTAHASEVAGFGSFTHMRDAGDKKWRTGAIECWLASDASAVVEHTKRCVCVCVCVCVSWPHALARARSIEQQEMNGLQALLLPHRHPPAHPPDPFQHAPCVDALHRACPV